MSKSFTPGPWVPVQGHEGVRFYAGETEEQFIWCEKSADARLIASAPIMLEILQRVNGLLNPFGHAQLVDDIAEVIRHATGGDK